MKSKPAEPSVNCKLKIKVVPGASQTTICGWLGDSLKVRVAAPPEKGRANSAVEKLISHALNLRSDAVRVESGFTSPHKVVSIDGLTRSDIIKQLSNHDA